MLTINEMETEEPEVAPKPSNKRKVGVVVGVVGVVALVCTTAVSFWGFDHHVVAHKELTELKVHKARELQATCASWCNVWTCGLAACSGCGSDVGCGPQATNCDAWCNLYTCSSSRCSDCSTCTEITAGSYCAPWCSSYTCPYATLCGGCEQCSANNIGLDGREIRVPPIARTADTSTKITMLWDRFQVLEKTHLYGWLIDQYKDYCPSDGNCYGDLFADNAWICTTTHLDVQTDYIDWDTIYPGAPPASNGAAITGSSCVSNLGTQSQETINAATAAGWSATGTYPSQGQQTRHTVNDFVVEYQTASSMTVLVYEIVERFILRPSTNAFVAYDGSGRTVQMKWTKDANGIWKILTQKVVKDGDGHLGLPPAQGTHNTFVDGMFSYTNGRRLGEVPTPPPRQRQLQAAGWGNMDPKISRTYIPAGASDSTKVQMAWDRWAMIDRIGMYSWLADETRVNDPKGYAWGDLFADDATFCIYTSSQLQLPFFGDVVAGATLFGNPVVGGGASPECNAATGTTCNSCTPNMGSYAQAVLQAMGRGTFGFNSAAQNNQQQTRHTLTNWIFLDQQLTTATTQVYNTLERYINGIAYDGSFFVYQHHWVKQSGVWKWQKIMAINTGNGHLGGFPNPAEFQQFLAGLQGNNPSTTPPGGLPGNVAGRRLGDTEHRRLAVGNPVTPTPPYNIQSNPLVSRIPPDARYAISSGDLATATTMLWDRAEIFERLHLYPWLADETRRNKPKGYLWGDLYADGATFCIYQYFDVQVILPPWDDITATGPAFAGGGPAGAAVTAATGLENTCQTGLGAYTQAAFQNMIDVSFGTGSGMQNNKQQTRHTFSNFVFTQQNLTNAQTLNYNIVERFVSGIAYDGSSFLYRMNWVKLPAGRWASTGAVAIVFGHANFGSAPTPSVFQVFQDRINAFTNTGR